MTIWRSWINSTRMEKGWNTTPCPGVQGETFVLGKSLLLQPLNSESKNPQFYLFIYLLILKIYVFPWCVLSFKVTPAISSQLPDETSKICLHIIFPLLSFQSSCPLSSLATSCNIVMANTLWWTVWKRQKILIEDSQLGERIFVKHHIQ